VHETQQILRRGGARLLGELLAAREARPGW
jgi:hypothetical protein